MADEDAAPEFQVGETLRITWYTHQRADKELNSKMDSKVKWNFQKYLIDKNGELIDFFYSLTSPKSVKITSLLTK